MTTLEVGTVESDYFSHHMALEKIHEADSESADPSPVQGDVSLTWSPPEVVARFWPTDAVRGVGHTVVKVAKQSETDYS